MEEVRLFFDEERHRYTDNLGTDYTSTTQVIEKYYPKFNRKKTADRCAAAGRRGNPKYAGKTAKQLLAEWEVMTKVAQDKGNVKHSYLEVSIKQANNYVRVGDHSFIQGHIYTIQDILKPHDFGDLDLEFFTMIGIRDKYPKIYNVLKILVDNGYKLYAEIGVFNLSYWVSGLIDLFALKGHEFIIVDWKTNKAPITYDAGYYEKDADGNMTGKFIKQMEFMHPPISNLNNSSGNRYALQLSTYAHLAEEFGLTNVGIILCHIRDANKAFDDFGIEGEVVEILPISYFKHETVAMLTDNTKRRENIQSKIGLWQ